MEWLRRATRGTLIERMGIELLEVAADRAVATMPVAGNTQPYGLLHGGASAVLAETLGSCAAMVHAGEGRAAVALCLDVGHQCVVGTSGDDRDPYAWLERLGARSPVIHLQQSDAEADHHWPFTAARNAQGRIDAGRVLDALEASGAREVALVLEVIPSFEQDDDLVLAELAESADHWRAALGIR